MNWLGRADDTDITTVDQQPFSPTFIRALAAAADRHGMAR